ncbi:MAG: hypothetical protein U0176_13035 [Bacteroidia bacterium]
MQLWTATAWAHTALEREKNRSSNRRTREPVVNHPDRNVATTSSISDSVINARWYGTWRGAMATLDLVRKDTWTRGQL